MIGREHDKSYLGCAGVDFPECLTLPLSITDLDLKLMHLMMKLNVVILFPSRGAFISDFFWPGRAFF